MKKYVKLVCGGVGLFLGAVTLSCNNVHADPRTQWVEVGNDGAFTFSKDSSREFRTLIGLFFQQNKQVTRTFIREQTSSAAPTLEQKDLERAFLFAAKQGLLYPIKLLIENGVNDESFLEAAFFDATRNGHLNIVKYLTPNVGVNNLNIALPIAAKHGHLDIVAYIVDTCEADVNNLNQAFISATRNGNLDIVQFLFDAGVNNENILKRASVVARRNNCVSVEEFLEGKIREMQNSAN